MRRPRIALFTALIALPAILYGCVQLTGQRFTWFHDKAADALHVLIQYDGIHEAKGGMMRDGRKGKEQIPQFLADGDVMVADWIGHLQRKRQRPQTAAAARLWQAIDTWKVQAIGRYREPNGQVGAAQLVTIPKLSACLAAANRAFDAHLLAEGAPEQILAERDDAVAWRTLDKMLRFAKKGTHQWIRANGHAIELRLPVDRDEWAHFKGKALVEGLVEFLAEHQKKPFSMVYQQALKTLGAVPISYSETGEIVTLTLGDPKQPRTWHIPVHDTYNDELEAVVKKHVPADFDQLLFADATKLAPPLRKMLGLLPMEVRVSALLDDLASGPEQEKAAAIERLTTYAADWNSRKGFPTAPLRGDTSLDAWVASWRKWYAKRRFRLDD